MTDQAQVEGPAAVDRVSFVRGGTIKLTLELGQQLLGLGITGISRLLEHLTCQICVQMSCWDSLPSSSAQCMPSWHPPC